MSVTTQLWKSRKMSGDEKYRFTRRYAEASLNAIANRLQRPQVEKASSDVIFALLSKRRAYGPEKFGSGKSTPRRTRSSTPIA
jgi:hypothetical protein